MIAALMAPTAARAWDDVVSVASADARLGAQLTTAGLAFGLYAPHATQVELLLFDQPAATTPHQIVPLQRAGDIWRIGIRGTTAPTRRVRATATTTRPSRPIGGSTRSTWSTGACWTGTTACPPKGRPTGPSCSIGPGT